MIQVKNLAFAYGKTPILKDVSFHAASGDIVAVLGRNGAGKSTLVTCLNRIRTPQSGDISIAGAPLSDYSREDLAQTIAYVAQSTEVSRMTVFDSVLLGRKPYINWSVSDEDVQLCAKMIDRLGLSEMQLRMITQLSGGELQKVMLARALVQEPKVLILDEPTSNLDPRNQYEMLSLVREVAAERGITVVVVLHDLNLAFRYCTKFLFLHEGKEYAFVNRTEVTEEIINHVYDIDATLATVGGHTVISIDVATDN